MNKMAEQKEFPEEGELVLCTVTEISKTSAFANLDDYGKVGILITAEVAPGRIRNIRDYISPNKKIVCKVLRVDKERGHIDLSLRRVSLKERKDVMEMYKKDKDALSILNRVVDKSKIGSVILGIKAEFQSLSEFLYSARSDANLFRKFGMEKESDKLVELIKERIKVHKISLRAKLRLFSREEQSLTMIKKAMTIKKPGVKITYISAPNYLVTVESTDYKEAKSIMKEVIKDITNNLKEINCYIEVKDE